MVLKFCLWCLQFADVKKMPLGKLSKSQISKGFDVLEELEGAVKLNKKKQLEELTSRFYTLIPHDFGRQKPPIINTLETVRKKKDMLLVRGQNYFTLVYLKNSYHATMMIYNNDTRIF